MAIHSNNGSTFSLKSVAVVVSIAGMFKFIAALTTVNSLATNTALEAAPAANLLISTFGVVPAVLVLEIMQFALVCPILASKYVRARSSIFRACAVLLVALCAFDGIWDLEIFLERVFFFVNYFTALQTMIVFVAALLATLVLVAVLEESKLLSPHAIRNEAPLILKA